MLLADVDFFKRFNDKYGHLQGDDCLKQIALALQSVCKRPTDLVARFGGEEFAVILPHTSVENAESMAEKLRAAVEMLNIPHEYSDAASVCTLSLGVYSIIADQDSSAEGMLQKADAALYRAKQQGRNRFETYQSE